MFLKASQPKRGDPRGGGSAGMAQHGKCPRDKAAQPAGVVRNGALCPPTPQIYWKAKGIAMLPLLPPPHLHVPAQHLLPVPIWISSAELRGFPNPIHAVATTPAHIWVCQLLGQRMPMRRPSARVRAVGS